MKWHWLIKTSNLNLLLTKARNIFFPIVACSCQDMDQSFRGTDWQAIQHCLRGKTKLSKRSVHWLDVTLLACCKSTWREMFAWSHQCQWSPERLAEYLPIIQNFTANPVCTAVIHITTLSTSVHYVAMCLKDNMSHPPLSAELNSGWKCFEMGWREGVRDKLVQRAGMLQQLFKAL